MEGVVLVGAQGSHAGNYVVLVLGREEDGVAFENLDQLDGQDDEADSNDEDGGEPAALMVELGIFLDFEIPAFREHVQRFQHFFI